MNRGRAALMASTLILSSAVSIAHESSETSFTYIHACTRNNPSALLLSFVWTCTEAFSHRNDTVQSCAYGDVRKKTDGGNRCSFFCVLFCGVWMKQHLILNLIVLSKETSVVFKVQENRKCKLHIFNCKSGPCLCKRLRHNVRVVVRAFRVSFAVWLPCIYVNMCVCVWLVFYYIFTLCIFYAKLFYICISQVKCI